jgi:hypothetical protein
MGFILSNSQSVGRCVNIAVNHTNPMANIERDSCRFKAIQGADGKFVVRMEMFHKTVSLLADATVDFELLNGSTLDQARKLAESMNDRVTGVLITKP